MELHVAMRQNLIMPQLEVYANDTAPATLAAAKEFKCLLTTPDADNQVALARLIQLTQSDAHHHHATLRYRAHFLLSLTYTHGGFHNIPVQPESANRHLQWALKGDDAAAHGWIGYQILSGSQGAQHSVVDTKNAIKHLNKACRAGDVEATINMAILLHPNFNSLNGYVRFGGMPDPNKQESQALFESVLVHASTSASVCTVLATTFFESGGAGLSFLRPHECIDHPMLRFPKFVENDDDDDYENIVRDMRHQSESKMHALNAAGTLQSATAQFLKALCIEQDRGWMQTRLDTLELYKLGVKNMLPAALNAMAIRVLISRSSASKTIEEVRLAMKHLEDAARAGLAVAQHNFAECLVAHAKCTVTTLISVKERTDLFSKAIRYYRAASAQGLSTSSWRLALLLKPIPNSNDNKSPSSSSKRRGGGEKNGREVQQKWIDLAVQQEHYSRLKLIECGSVLVGIPLFPRPAFYLTDDDDDQNDCNAIVRPTAECPESQPAFAHAGFFMVLGLNPPCLPRALGPERCAHSVNHTIDMAVATFSSPILSACSPTAASAASSSLVRSSPITV